MAAKSVRRVRRGDRRVDRAVARRRRRPRARVDPRDITLAKEKAARVEREVAKDVRVLQREIAIDKEIARDEVINEAITFERFIENEPPVLVGFLALFVVNGFIGLTWALFFRETSAGPGGEFGKGIVALRKELVKGIFKFFGTVMGSYVERDGGKSR